MTSDFISLKAPEGHTDVSFGGENFKVGQNGTVAVPTAAAEHLYQFGFVNHVAPEAGKPAADAPGVQAQALSAGAKKK